VYNVELQASKQLSAGHTTFRKVPVHCKSVLNVVLQASKHLSFGHRKLYAVIVHIIITHAKPVVHSRNASNFELATEYFLVDITL
jgi:hypothetical protein